MAIYEVTAPDGKTYEIEGSGSKEQALEHFKENWKSAQEQPKTQEAPKDLTPYQALLEGIKNPVIPEGRTPYAGAALAGLGGETLKNIGAATQLVSPSIGNPIVEAGQAMTKSSDAISPTATTIGQIGAYANPTALLSKGANLLAGGSKTLPSMMGQSALVGGATGLLTTPGEAADRLGTTVLNTAMGAGMPVIGKGIELVGKKIAPMLRNVPSQEELINKAKGLFGKAEESGVKLNANDFSSYMGNIGKDLRAEGFDARLMPKVGVALEELQNAGIPKDFQELSTLRKFIQNAQKSSEPDERRVATILKDKFDDYVANIPEEHIGTTSKAGLEAWKEARDTYAKVSKADIFEEMLARSDLDKTKYTQSGSENSLAMQLRNLAKNEKRMRLFTAEEQDAIKEAAKGTITQNVLRMIGKYAPTSPISMGIGAGIGAHLGGPIGAAVVPLVGETSKIMATKLRENSVKNLADFMRAGGQDFEIGSRMNLTPEQQKLAQMLMLQQSTQGK